MGSCWGWVGGIWGCGRGRVDRVLKESCGGVIHSKGCSSGHEDIVYKHLNRIAR